VEEVKIIKPVQKLVQNNAISKSLITKDIAIKQISENNLQSKI